MLTQIPIFSDLWIYRKAQGCGPHYRRIPFVCCLDREIRIRSSSGWQVRLHGWCGLDHRSHVSVQSTLSQVELLHPGYRYIVYGPLANGVTTTVFESTPVYPSPSRYWETVAKHKLTQFYSAPTAIRLLRRHGEQHVHGHDLSSLRVLGTVGEPINPEAWNWYNEHVGRKQCAIVDTFWLVFFSSIINFTSIKWFVFFMICY